MDSVSINILRGTAVVEDSGGAGGETTSYFPCTLGTSTLGTKLLTLRSGYPCLII